MTFETNNLTFQMKILIVMPVGGDHDCYNVIDRDSFKNYFH